MITDAQIRELRDANIASPRVSEVTVPPDGKASTWRLFIETDCNVALGVTPDSRALSEDANRVTRETARERCAEVIAALRLATITRATTGAGCPCTLCEKGFRRVGGTHLPSQKLGMIPETPCEQVFAVRGEGADTARPWIAYVDGEILREKNGRARRFGSAEGAYKAACEAAPRKWHP